MERNTFYSAFALPTNMTILKVRIHTSTTMYQEHKFECFI